MIEEFYDEDSKSIGGNPDDINRTMDYLIDYLDSIGYDNGDDDCDGYDPDDNHGFQNGVFDNIIF